MKHLLLKQLADQILSLTSREEVIDFLRGILTTKELQEIPQRLEIVRMIKRGTTQRIIAQKLGVGVATVTRGSRELQQGRFQMVKEHVARTRSSWRTPTMKSGSS